MSYRNQREMNSQQLYGVIDRDGLIITQTVALLRGWAIGLAMECLNADWETLVAEGYRVVTFTFTPEVCSDQTPGPILP